LINITQKQILFNQCIKTIVKYITITKDDLIIEPSAGNGSFIEGVKKLTNNYIFYDLEPENSEIINKILLILIMIMNLMDY